MKLAKIGAAGVLALLMILTNTMEIRAEGQDKAETTEGVETGVSGGLRIDNRNCYKGMDKTYSQGYVPRVEEGRVQVVIPLLCDSRLKGDVLETSLNLGDTQNTPFVYKNYNKNITRKKNPINDGSKKKAGFLAAFMLELKADRINGSYPVILSVKGTDTAGNELQQDFTVYVTVTDGKDPNAVQEPVTDQTEPEPPVFVPKVLVQSYRFIKQSAESGETVAEENVTAGDTVTAEITLVNTSDSNSVQNMTAAVAANGEYLTLLSPSDSVYVGSLGAGKTCVISYDYRIGVETPEGQYDLTLTMDYADGKGNVYTGSGSAKLSVKQPVSLQFDPVMIRPQMEVGDVAEVQLQAMNLGRSKAYNVRAVVEADGLTPQGTVFIGDIEPGTVAAGSTRIAVGGLSGGSTYGKTKGTVTFCYEDGAGNELTEVQNFQTEVTSPFTQKTEEKDETGQWWIIMAVIAGSLCICGVIVLTGRWKGKKKDEQMEEIPKAEKTE